MNNPYSISFLALVRCSSALLLTLFCATSAYSTTYQIAHLEPMNWWVGMHNPELQLMVHGEAIADLHPSVNYQGVTLTTVERTSNSNYLFINLHIANATAPGTLELQFSNKDGVQLRVPYRLESRRAGSAERSSFSAKDVIYLITPDRFANGNSANDNHPSMLETANRNSPISRHGGDIQGIAKNLDYIARMGFTMIWPTPMIENNQPEYSYHGYSPTNLYQMDPRMGSNEDYKNLVAAAHKKGIGFIQDIVLNHIGSGHWWMKDLPTHNWLNFQNGFVPTNNQHTTVLDIHAAPEDIENFTDGWFVATMPDMNQRNPLLARYLIQNTIWWIEYADLDGIREDTYAYSDKAFLAHWSKAVLDEYPHFNIVGEEMNSNPHILAYWQKGVINRDGYASNLPTLMDFPIVYLMPEVLNAEESSGDGLIKLYEMIANDFVYADPMKLMLFPDNHDMSRIYSLLHENLELFKTSLLFTATTRGIAQFYYGTEVLTKSPYKRDDGLLRADFPGGWDGDTVNGFTGKGLSADQKKAQTFLRQLLNWRKTSSAIAEGNLTHYLPENGHYVYFRSHERERVMVVINKNKMASTLNLTRFQRLLRGYERGENVVTNESIDLTKPLLLAPLESIVISL
jgi:glycosidase